MGSPFGFGGAGIRAYEIYNRLKERHDITLLCMRYPGAKDGEIEGLQHLFVGMESNKLVPSVLAYLLKAMQFIRKNGNRFDIIVENFLPPTPFLSQCLTKTPVILQIQDFWGKHTFKRYPLSFALPMFLVEKFYPKLYKRIIFVSAVTREQFHLSAKAVILPNGIDENLLQAAEKTDNSILFISSIDRYKKGLDILLKAFSQISRFYQKVGLSIAGTGRDFNVVRDEIDKLPDNVKKNIKLLGWVSGEEKIKAISRALFTVLPSRHESAPISIIEAAACGKAVIVSDIPELKFVEEQGFGLRFPSESVRGLQEKMEILLNNDEMRQRFGLKGREYAQHYRWDALALQYEEVLNTACRTEKL